MIEPTDIETLHNLIMPDGVEILAGIFVGILCGLVVYFITRKFKSPRAVSLVLSILVLGGMSFVTSQAVWDWTREMAEQMVASAEDGSLVRESLSNGGVKYMFAGTTTIWFDEKSGEAVTDFMCERSLLKWTPGRCDCRLSPPPSDQ